jgi:hypothetical protein
VLITPADLAEAALAGALRWDVSDLAYDNARFLRPHGDSAEDAETWEQLSALIRRAGS